MEWAKFGNEELEQGTGAWREARKRRLGGSEIASVLNLSPYKTRLQLWLEKTGHVEPPDISHMPHVRRGIDAEPIAREQLERRHRVKYITPTLIHPDYPHFSASLDGQCRDHILEIKTMSKDKHEDVRAGLVPDYYEAQCQWNMMIASAASGRLVDKCLFASYRPEDNTLYDLFLPAKPDWQAEMLARGIEFWGWVTRKERPPDIVELDLEGLL